MMREGERGRESEREHTRARERQTLPASSHADVHAIWFFKTFFLNNLWITLWITFFLSWLNVIILQRPGSHCLGEDLDERRQPFLKLPDGKVPCNTESLSNYTHLHACARTHSLTLPHAHTLFLILLNVCWRRGAQFMWRRYTYFEGCNRDGEGSGRGVPRDAYSSRWADLHSNGWVYRIV